MVRVLIADDDLDSHELIDDLIEINYRDVNIERALTKESFLVKVATAAPEYDLILFNTGLEKSSCTGEIVDYLEANHPDVLSRIVFISPDMNQTAPLEDKYPVITRPFSIDRFGEVIQSVCAFQ